MQQLIKQTKPEFFFDIGAHAGLYSLLAINNYSEMEVHAFEPDLQDLSQRYANLYLNRLYYTVNIHTTAISSISGTTYLERSDGTSRATRHIVSEGDYEVKVCKFDDMFSDKFKRAFFKIDVEGFEFEVIEGAMEYLSENECILLIESFPPKFEKLNKKMSNLGYKEVEFSGNQDDHIFINFELIL